MKVTEYTVEWADWAPDLSDVYETHHDSVWDWPEPTISNRIDERTWHVERCSTEAQAVEFARSILEDRQNDPWLAILEIHRHTYQRIAKIK